MVSRSARATERVGAATRSMASSSSHPAPAPAPGRAELVKAFDDARTGVRGLVESGVSSVPELFRHPGPYASIPLAPPGVSIPVVDLSLPPHLAAAAAASAARTWGFFHLVNALPADDDEYPARAFAAVRAFNELPAAERAPHYSRRAMDDDNAFSYYSNIDPYNSPAASWRDTMHVLLGPDRRPDIADRIPAACRAELLEWEARVSAVVAPALLGLLSQGLGLRPSALEDASCAEGKRMVCHYYPQCPEPERALGIVPHTDPSVVNVLAQDAVGGLQVKHQDEDGKICWVDVQPVPGALVVNIGDLLQIMSNDKYTSVEHRVVMNTREEPRVSISIFFSPGERGDSVIYGPLPELVSSENPPKYRNFTMSEFYGAFFSRDLTSKALLDKFKLLSEVPTRKV